VTRSAYDPRRYWDRRLERTWSLQGVGLKGYSPGCANVWVREVSGTLCMVKLHLVGFINGKVLIKPVLGEKISIRHKFNIHFPRKVLCTLSAKQNMVGVFHYNSCKRNRVFNIPDS
jgi:hypothetical protein